MRRSGMVNLRDRTAATLTFLLAVFAAAVGSTNIIRFASDWDILEYAIALQDGEGDSNGKLVAFLNDRRSGAAAQGCSDLASRARMAIAQAGFEAFPPADAGENNGDGLAAHAIAAVAARLACNPLDGAAWLQLAKFRLRAGAPLEAVAADLRMSYLLAPSEDWIVEARLDFLMSPAGFDLAKLMEANFNGDLRTFVGFEPIWSIAGRFVKSDSKGQAVLQHMIDVQPDARRTDIRKAIDRLKGGGP